MKRSRITMASAILATVSVLGSGFVATVAQADKVVAKKVEKAKPLIDVDPQATHKIKLELGDILLYIDKGYTTGVAAGQGITRLNPVIAFRTHKGSIYTHHAAVVSDIKENRHNRKNERIMGAAHSVGVEGVSFKKMEDERGLKIPSAVHQSYLVFRLKDPKVRAKWGVAAADVARQWTGGPPNSRSEYADFSALLSPAFHSSSYGKHAKARMEAFYKARDKENGPGGKFFCSQLAVAIYQGALGKESEQLMALDADYTSPMKLHHYLVETKAWTLVGEEFLDGKAEAKAAAELKALAEAEAKLKAEAEAKAKADAQPLSFKELLDRFQASTDKKLIANVMAAAKRSFGDDQLHFLTSVRDYKAATATRGVLAERMEGYYFDPSKNSALNISSELRKTTLANVAAAQKAAHAARRAEKTYVYAPNLFDAVEVEVRKMVIGQAGADHPHLWEALRKLFTK